MQEPVQNTRADGYVNQINQYGTAQDTSERYSYQAEPSMSDELLAAIYESNGLFARIIDAPAEDAMRCGFAFENMTDRKAETYFRAVYDSLDGNGTFATALRWARVFGGSLAVMLIDDGRGIEEPLDYEHIRSIEDIVVYDRSIVRPDTSTMFSGAKLGMPDRYMIYSKHGSFTVHESRCLIFQNGVLPERCTNCIYQFWGMPEYIRIKNAIKNTEVSYGAAPRMLARAVQAVYRMKNLSEILATDGGEEIVLKRLQTIDLARGLLNSITIDSEGEDYDFKQFQFSGVTEVIDASIGYLSAVTAIPQSILNGKSISGWSSRDDTTMENYYNMVERLQRGMVGKNLRRLARIIFCAGVSQGKIQTAPHIRIKFKPLWSMTAVEQAKIECNRETTKRIKAQTAETYIKMGALKVHEVRRGLASRSAVDAETVLYQSSAGGSQ